MIGITQESNMKKLSFIFWRVIRCMMYVFFGIILGRASAFLFYLYPLTYFDIFLFLVAIIVGLISGIFGKESK